MLSFFIKVTKPFRWHILGLLAINVIWAIDLSLRPFILKIILDKIPYLSTTTQSSILQGLFKPVFAYVFMFSLMAIVMRVYDRLWMIINPNLKKQITIKMVESLMEHSYFSYQNSFSGNLANKVNDIIVGICSILKTVIDHFFSQLMALSIAIFTVWQVNPKFSIILILWVALFIGISSKLSNKAKLLSSMAANARSKVFGNLVDILINIVNVRLFDSKILEKKRLEHNVSISVKADQRRDWFFLKIYAVQGASFVLIQTICLWWLLNGLQKHTITIGDFALILSINMSLVDYLWVYLRMMRESSEQFGNIVQAMHILEAKTDLKEHLNAKKLVVTDGSIVFENVTFSYNEKSNLFVNQNIIIKPSQKVGLVGYSGSGKSTFVNLILRLFDVTSGNILIDGQNIQHVTQSSLKQAIAMIPQDPSLFHRSIINNICYNNNGISREEVIQAAKKAHAHGFIAALPDGYDTLVGERGVKLSGGQRQRIAITRAILKNSPILILDEATSQLDSVTEQQIQESLLELMKYKTTIVIAHRLSTLLNMDRILVFDQGKIIQDGTHDELLKENGLYRELWDAQVGDFLPDREFEVVLDNTDTTYEINSLEAIKERAAENF